MTGGTLKALFLGHQETLKAELLQARTAMSHPTLKGDRSECRWRGMLERHLPRRYRVCRGVVVDSHGAQSDAIDVIVHDAHYCPLLLDKDGTCFVPAESVYAVFEVKQAIATREIRYAGEKAESVRRLHRTSAAIVDRGEARPPRDLPPILAGIVALEAKWADGFGGSFRRALASLTEEGRLDLGCVLAAGSFELGESDGTVAVFPPETALVSFFVRLVARLQGIGTVPAIEWHRYAGGLSVPEETVPEAE